MQADVDTTYFTFKSRVADGRKKDIVYIDSIAQGHVWTGQRAIGLGLADRMGTLQDAVNCAARMAHIRTYYTKEYPEIKFNLQDVIRKTFTGSIQVNTMKEQLGTEQYKLLMQVKKLQGILNTSQMRLPFSYDIK